MKRLFITILILVAIAIVNAQEKSNPLRDYLNEPALETWFEALDYLEELCFEEESSLGAQLNLVYILNMESGRILERLMEHQDTLSNAQRFMLGNILLSIKNYEDALKIYDKLNADFPKWSCPWRHKGETLFRMKDYIRAALSLEKAIETNPEHYDAYIWMALTQNELAEYAKALENLEKAFKLDPEAEDSHFDEEIPEGTIEKLYQELKTKTGK